VRDPDRTVARGDCARVSDRDAFDRVPGIAELNQLAADGTRPRVCAMLPAGEHPQVSVQGGRALNDPAEVDLRERRARRRRGHGRVTALGVACDRPPGHPGRHQHRCDREDPAPALSLPPACVPDDRPARWWPTTLDSLHDDASITSTMLGVKIDRDQPALLHDQVAAEIRRAIADGEAAPGERLPPARDFAAVLGVNTNTVLRALRQLRDEGLLEFRRGRGVHVAATPERGALVAKTRDLVQFGRRYGYGPDELIDIIKKISA